MPYAIVVLLILLSGGVSYASESALPGDLLYPIKIDVNENVRMRMSTSVQAKAQTDADLAVRRLEEAEKLLTGTGLDAAALTQIEGNFQRHADGVVAQDRKFASQDLAGATDIISSFETSLEAHDLVLAQLAAKPTGATDKTEKEKLRAKIEAEHKTTTDLREELETRVAGETGPDVQTAAEGRKQAAENKIAEVKKFIESKKAKLGITVIADANAQLAVAEKTFADGGAKFDTGAYGEAFTLFSAAHRIAQGVKLLIEADLDLGTDIHAAAANASNEVRADQASLEARMRDKVESGTTTGAILNDDGGSQGKTRGQTK